MADETHATLDDLLLGLPHIREAPRDEGRLELIVRRPRGEEREVLDEGTLDLEVGLVGDDWLARGSKHTADGAAHPEMQIAIMGARSIGLIAMDRARWPLAGDQLFIDMDLSTGNLPTGARLSIGPVVLEITPYPHRGCKKFLARFGKDSMEFLSSPEGSGLRLRGVYARVVTPGVVRTGDVARKVVAE